MARDSYRPSRPRPPPSSLSDRVTFGGNSNGARDSNNPRPRNHTKFTFQADRQGPSFPPSGPAAGNNSNARRSGTRDRRSNNHHNPDNRRGGRGGQRGGQRGGFRRPLPAHERKILQHRQTNGPEQTLGVDPTVNKFRDLSDLPDELMQREREHDPATPAMDDPTMGDGHGEGGDAEGDSVRKTARLSKPRPDGDQPPRWSNPDPYSAIPPTMDGPRMAFDPVKAIRNAKNEAAQPKPASASAVAANDDFISFGNDDPGSDDDSAGSEPDRFERGKCPPSTVTLSDPPPDPPTPPAPAPEAYTWVAQSAPGHGAPTWAAFPAQQHGQTQKSWVTLIGAPVKYDHVRRDVKQQETSPAWNQAWDQHDNWGINYHPSLSAAYNGYNGDDLTASNPTLVPLDSRAWSNTNTLCDPSCRADPVAHETNAFLGSMNEVFSHLPPPPPPPGLPPQDAAPPPPPNPQLPRRKREHQVTDIVGEWQPVDDATAAPWCENDQYIKQLANRTSPTDTQKMTMLLHNEIMDFYDYVRPTQKEDAVRNELIREIELVIAKSILPGRSRVACFGSFPQGLYLPTADMDLVLVSDRNDRHGESSLSSQHQTKNALFSARDKLRRALDIRNAIVIAKAKVPIVKFVENRTGIKVDLSLENLSGLPAQQSFRQWLRESPHLSELVALVKQFLMMRELNDVHSGGLGGFSIICLVHSYLSITEMQRAEQGNNAQPNLGELLLNFLDFWGNQFDIRTQRLIMAPTPRIAAKGNLDVDGKAYGTPFKLSIQDPNNASNNISGGSRRAHVVLQKFRDAFFELSDRVSTLDRSGSSILASIIGGNYRSYQTHRNAIDSAHHRYGLP